MKILVHGVESEAFQKIVLKIQKDYELLSKADQTIFLRLMILEVLSQYVDGWIKKEPDVNFGIPVGYEQAVMLTELIKEGEFKQEQSTLALNIYFAILTIIENLYKDLSQVLELNHEQIAERLAENKGETNKIEDLVATIFLTTLGYSDTPSVEITD